MSIRVEDSGPGIIAEEIPFIFDRFYRGKGQQREGSGLGLAIAKSVAEAHGGQIELESNFGKGSQFTLILPLVK